MNHTMNVRSARMFWAPLILAAIGVAVLAAAANAQTYTATSVSAMSGTTAGMPSFASSPDLTIGSTGAYVYDLQSFLAEQGYLSVYPTGYFGAMTQSALAAYQSAHGVPATGYFGPLSKASITAWIATRSSTVAMNVGTSINPVSTNGTSVSTSMLAPLFPTGYWYQGNWYGVIPTSTKDIAGYWNNGVWYPINNVPGMSTSVATANSGTGYWYNGIFYPTSSSNVGGNASIDQAQGISSSTQADSSAANASSSFGVSKSNWNPYPGTVTGTSVSMSCGYETSSSGTTFICR